MNKKGSASIQRGQAITFRLPSDTPDHLLKQIQMLKDIERRNFSSKIAEFVLEGVGGSLSKDRETITLPLPKKLSKDQRNWLKHSHSEALLGSIVYQLLADPVRATSILASLNSNALDIDEALYLQEVEPIEIKDDDISTVSSNEMEELEEETALPKVDDLELDLINFDWEKVRQEQASAEEEDQDQQEDIDDLLGGFLANMNK
ncbi:hypothetical protein WQ54_24710 [Bacillus sp. SA1-12]|uniref:hypothetical protein n=1 Tax=Bacillus sp. SA1-12 TaxID=1455638 RepID=UPI000626FC35|nr:hypothetical protein [Bacillus sp. SA1-12]KKI89568.1 hypothetical protein WQ54_24710 [Bacillus sp. SA1-12]